MSRSDAIPYTLQDSANKLTIEKQRTNCLRNSFRYSGAVLWNSLPQPLRQAESLTNNYHGSKEDTASIGNKFSI